MDAIPPGCVGSRGHDATFVRGASRPPPVYPEIRVEKLFDRDEKRVHVHVENGPGHACHRAASTRGSPARSAISVISAHPEASIARTGSERSITEFQHQPAARTKDPLGLRNQPCIHRVTVFPGEERDMRLVVAHLPLKTGCVASAT